MTKEEMMQVIKEARQIKPDERTFRTLVKLQNIHECHRCGKCCKETTIGMTGTEVVTIARFLGMTGAAFKEQYITQQVERWLVIRLTEERACPFLREEAGTYSCSIHEVRPNVCRNYPFLSPATIMASKYPRINFQESMCAHMKDTIEKANHYIKEAQP